MITACDFGICFLDGEFKVNPVSTNVLVPVFRTEDSHETARTMFWIQPGSTICHLRLLLFTDKYPHHSGSRHFTAVSMCSSWKHQVKWNIVCFPSRHWDEAVLNMQQLITMGCSQPTSPWPWLPTPLCLLSDVRCSSCIPQPPWHSLACSCCVHTPVQQSYLGWRGSRRLLCQLLSKMPDCGVIFPLLSPASER